MREKGAEDHTQERERDQKLENGKGKDKEIN